MYFVLISLDSSLSKTQIYLFFQKWYALCVQFHTGLPQTANVSLSNITQLLIH